MTVEMDAFDSHKKEESRMSKPNKKVQDSVFRDLFSSKENLYDLYKNLHPEDNITTLNDIQNVALRNILMNDIFNDLGLLIGEKMIILTEHQSTVNRNMPVRSLLYYTHTLQDYVLQDAARQRKLYQSTLMKLPSPEFYVVYTGDNEKFLGKELLLSDAFELTGFLEVKVKVLSPEKVEKTSVLGQYLTFVRRFKENRLLYDDPRQAIAVTVSECIDSGVLEGYLMERKGEIADMLLNGLEIEKIVGTAEENRMDGVKEGREEGRKEGIILGAITAYVSLDLPRKEIVSNIVKMHNLSELEAEEFIKAYEKAYKEIKE